MYHILFPNWKYDGKYEIVFLDEQENFTERYQSVIDMSAPIIFSTIVEYEKHDGSNADSVGKQKKKWIK